MLKNDLRSATLSDEAGAVSVIMAAILLLAVSLILVLTVFIQVIIVKSKTAAVADLAAIEAAKAKYYSQNINYCEKAEKTAEDNEMRLSVCREANKGIEVSLEPRASILIPVVIRGTAVASNLYSVQMDQKM